MGSEWDMCVGSRVYLVGVSISFEKNFYRLPFTPPSLVRRISPSSWPISRFNNGSTSTSLAFTSSGKKVTNPLRVITDEVVGTCKWSVNKQKRAKKKFKETKRFTSIEESVAWVWEVEFSANDDSRASVIGSCGWSPIFCWESSESLYLISIGASAPSWTETRDWIWGNRRITLIRILPWLGLQYEGQFV
jgi:hypothetical protein